VKLGSVSKSAQAYGLVGWMKVSQLFAGLTYNHSTWFLDRTIDTQEAESTICSWRAGGSRPYLILYRCIQAAVPDIFHRTLIQVRGICPGQKLEPGEGFQVRIGWNHGR
jgi:hypothetical protein